MKSLQRFTLMALIGCFPFSTVVAKTAKSQGPLSADLKVAVMKTSDFSDAANQVFADPLLSQVADPRKVGRMKHPTLKSLAILIARKQYDHEARLKVYEAYEPVDELAKRLKTSAYNRFENPTGIYFEAGKQAVLVVEGMANEAARLVIHNFGREGGHSEYALSNGINIFEVKNKGLGYISYYTSNWQEAPKLRIHTLSGQVNGVFYKATAGDKFDWPESKLKRLHPKKRQQYEAAKARLLAKLSVENNRKWQQLLAKAPAEVIDIVGQQVHLIYPVEELKSACPEDGQRLIELYDQIIGWQHEIMGLIKYNQQPKNRMLGRVIWKGFMHADGLGAAFHNSTMSSIANPDVIPSSAWGIAHEFGHVNQVRPGLKWVSTSEVTNNIYSAWTNFKLNPGSMRLEHERCNSGDGAMVGGRFNAYLNHGIRDGVNWLMQEGPDYFGQEKQGTPPRRNYDHFVKLAPLWQLQLYFKAAQRGNPDFMADVFERVRQTDNRGKSNGQLQLDFMRHVIDATRTDLSDFFKTVGMLKPIDAYLEDYSPGQMTITPEQCYELAKYAGKYRKPESPVIHYISVNSLPAYREGKQVEGGAVNAGCRREGQMVRVDHSVWQHVTVFEVYAGEELKRITMVGSGSVDNSFTTVPFPAGATEVFAVSITGKRIPVYKAS